MAKLEIGILPHIQNQRKALSAQFFELNPKKMCLEKVWIVEGQVGCQFSVFRGSHPLRSFIFLLAIVTLVGVHTPKICREVVICFHLKCQNFGNNRALAAKKLVVVCWGKFQHRTNVPRSDAHTTSTLPPVALKFKKICRQHVHVYLCTFTLPKFWLSDLLSPDVRLVTFANILAIFANRLALKYFCQSIGIFANNLAILMSVRLRCAHVWLCFWAGSA